MSQLANKQADTVRRAIIRLLKPNKRWVHTITADNGAEFAKHEGFAKQLGAAVYFGRCPRFSWLIGEVPGGARYFIDHSPEFTLIPDYS